VLDPIEAARLAHLRYVHDTGPGITRTRRGRSFVYTAPDGSRVSDSETLARIRSLAIPPAWTDVWICPLPTGHIQATGRDAKGRKQYRYHPCWREVRDETKYTKMIMFGEALPKIRAAVEADLARPGLPREKVLATVVRLLEVTLIRVGNEEYAKKNQSYGLTTLRNQHLDIEGSHLRFHFRGKSGKEHTIDVRDRRLAQIVRKCSELPGHELFQYLGEDGQRHAVESADVNAYLKQIAGDEFTAKDFRTWAGTVLAAHALQELQTFDTKTQAQKNIVAAIKTVAERLGNTPAVCRKCYVHPAVLGAYIDGALVDTLVQKADEELDHIGSLPPAEAAVLMLLRRRLAAA
jgi:DNA topoisomerase-1